MIRLIMSTFTVILFSLPTFPQQTFFTQIHDDKFHNPTDVIIKQNGNMMFCTQYWPQDKGWNSMIFEVNNFGEVMNEWAFNKTVEENLRCIRILEYNEQVYLFGEGHKTLSGFDKANVSIIKFDMQLNEIGHYSHIIQGIDPIRLLPTNVQCRDTTFHIVGLTMFSDINTTPFYFKTSPSCLNIHSSYYAPGTLVDIWPQGFYLLPGSDNLFTICQKWGGPKDVFCHFYEFDTMMSVVSDIPIAMNGSGLAMIGYKIIKSSDTTFYLAYNFWDLDEWSSKVTKFDLNGNILRDFIFECHEDSSSWIAHYNGMDTLPDGNLLLCTTWNLDKEFNVQQEPTKIMLFKLSPNLDLIWQKYLFGDDGMYEAYGVKAHPDGGIVVLGTYSRTPPTSQDIKEVFLMKTDSDGLLTHIGDGEPKIKTTEAILFPNPAGEIVYIEFSQVYQNAVFQLMDIGGKMVQEKQLNSNFQSVNISTIQAGTYVYRIFNKEGLDERGKVVVE